MLFTQLEFLLLFAMIVFFIFLIKDATSQKIILLISSYYFYAYWDWRFLSLILISTCIDYFVGLSLQKTKKPSYRHLLLIVSLVANLGILCIFKYFNFFISSFAPILSPFGFRTNSLNIILPIGISFYTFQTMSYTIDVYRKKIPVCTSLLDFSVFVAFFPQLVAGPIVRASQFLPQLKYAKRITLINVYVGLRIFIIGLFKKVFIADNLACFVDPVFETPSVFSGMTLWFAVIAYALQIYADFSGYSEMAIGSARILGYVFPRNFNMPYISKNFSEFWTRWHISLSSWLRDYLYIPLGGSRKSSFRTFFNLMATMLLGGLWHGAAWTFILWGGLHGSALSVQRIFAKMKLSKFKGFGRVVPGILGWAVTFLAVLIGWVFFRAQNFETSLLILGRMFSLADGISWFYPLAVGIIAGMAVVHIVFVLNHEKRIKLPIDSIISPIILFTMLFILIVFHPNNFNPFIYFRF
jgi:alginate O-acetyltransferase complex protein AlgI